MDTAAYFVDRIKSSSGNFAVASIPAYVRLDLGLVWKATRNLELSVWGQNLLDNAHPEFGTTQTPVITENPRTLYGQIKWRF